MARPDATDYDGGGGCDGACRCLVPAEVSPDVDPAPTTRTHDPELDSPRGRGPVVLDPIFAENQRLVANPFLALAASLPWLAAFRHAMIVRNLPLAVVLVAA